MLVSQDDSEQTPAITERVVAGAGADLSAPAEPASDAAEQEQRKVIRWTASLNAVRQHEREKRVTRKRHLKVWMGCVASSLGLAVTLRRVWLTDAPAARL